VSGGGVYASGYEEEGRQKEEKVVLRSPEQFRGLAKDAVTSR
jgi:hypothetical protein